MISLSLTTLTPIIVITVLSFFFKSTRGFGIFGIGIMAYFFPVLFLTLGAVAILIYSYHRFSK